MDEFEQRFKALVCPIFFSGDVTLMKSATDQMIESLSLGIIFASNGSPEKARYYYNAICIMLEEYINRTIRIKDVNGVP